MECRIARSSRSLAAIACVAAALVALPLAVAARPLPFSGSRSSYAITSSWHVPPGQYEDTAADFAENSALRFSLQGASNRQPTPATEQNGAFYTWYLGTIVAMLIVNAALFVFTLDGVVALYVSYLAALAILQLLSNDYVWQYALCTIVTFVAITWFARAFLRLRRAIPKLDGALLAWLAALVVTQAFSAVRLGDRTSNFAYFACVLGILVTILVASYRRLRQGYRPAGFLLLAFSAGTLFVVLALVKPFAVSNPMETGTAIDCILITFAIGSRLRSERRLQALLLRTSDAEHASATEDALWFDPRIGRTTGPFSIEVFRGRVLKEGAAVPLRDREAELVMALALHADPIAASQFAGMIWPDSDEAAALNSLRVTLSRIRTKTGDSSLVGRRAGMYELCADVAVDARELQQVLKDLRDGSTMPRRETMCDVYGRVAHQLPGALLVCEWFGPYERLLVAARRELAAAIVMDYISSGEPKAALATATTAIALDPSDEACYELLIRALLALGDDAAARRALRDCRAMTQRVYGDEPSRDITGLLERRAGRASDR
jgi:DNA-binding SARP family transcriptional activator